jgi:hypothetical protein
VSHRRHRLGAAVSAALQLALSFGLTANLVFCTDAAGHAAVESAYSADCCGDHVLPGGAGAGDEDCGCVDTPILQSPVETRQRSEYVPPSAQGLLAFLCPYPAASTAPQRRPILRSPAFPGVASHSRSVVLLI